LDQRLHAMDYLAYAHLQQGQDREAERVFEAMNAIQAAGEGVFTTAYAATAIPARLALERRQWREAASLELGDSARRLAKLADYGWATAHIGFARAVGAARSGNVAQAREELSKLRAIEDALVVPAGSYDWKTQVRIEREIAEAWTAHADGRGEEAVRLMRAAADLDDATEKHPVTPGAILPAREQLGELLIEVNRPREALTEYEASLNRAPRRLAGLYGAARAARLAGDTAKASRYFAELAEVTKSGDDTRAEIKEARVAASEVASR
jgi:tetratricopeptide (TPR) repeat protein